MERPKFNLIGLFDPDVSALPEIIGQLVAEYFGKKSHDELSESSEECDPWKVELQSVDVAFSVGFLYGSLFEIADSEELSELAQIKERLIRAGVLRYFPRTEQKITLKEEPQGAAKQT